MISLVVVITFTDDNIIDWIIKSFIAKNLIIDAFIIENIIIATTMILIR